MQFEQGAFMRSETLDGTKGLTVLETDESAGYRVMEKRDGEWVKPYWMPEEELQALIDAEKLTPIGQVGDEQFSRMRELSGVEA